MSRSKTLRPLFGDKHKEYIQAATRATVSVAEGAVRAGKTIDNIAAFAYMLEAGTPDRIHLATGSTAANAKLNIGDANGFGLEYIFRGRCRWTKYRGNEALVITVRRREYIVIFAGGGKADSYKKIRGNSYGMWIATEINLHHQDMIKEAFNRQLAAKTRRVFWDLNPTAPSSWIYAEYIDAFPLQLGDKYNYQHFTIRDNATITPERLAEIESQYVPSSVWYRRDILGQRCAAEGLIYQIFADHPAPYMIGDPIKWLSERNDAWAAVVIGVDFGGNASASKFQATGITRRGVVVALEEQYIDHRKTPVDPNKLNMLYAAFVERVTAKYGAAETRADSTEQILIRGLWHTAQAMGLRTQVKNCLKLPIMDRVRLTLLLMAQKRLFISKACPYLKAAFEGAVYDPDSMEDKRLDDGTSDIDSLDAFEYSIEPHYKFLEQMGHRISTEGDK